jgi:hypothetical protein
VVVAVADRQPPFSQIVREYGQQQGDNTMAASDAWKAWAEQLSELIADMPNRPTPWVYLDDGDRDLVEVGASHLSTSSMRDALHVVLAEADAVATALMRAAVLAEARSDELADKLAADECQSCGAASMHCSWSHNPDLKAGPGDCCDDCSHAGPVDERTCWAPGDQEHDHAMCQDVVAEDGESRG